MRVPRIPQLPGHKLPAAPNATGSRRPSSEKTRECGPSGDKSAHCRLIGHKTHEVEKRLLRNSRQSGRKDETRRAHWEEAGDQAGMTVTPCENRSSSQGQASDAALATARQQEEDIGGSDMMLRSKATSVWSPGLVKAVPPGHRPNWVELLNKVVEGSRPTIRFYRPSANHWIYPGYDKSCGPFCFRTNGDENKEKSATQPNGDQSQGSNQSRRLDPLLVTDAAATSCTCNELFRRYYKEHPTCSSKSLEGWFELFNMLGLKLPSNWVSIVLNPGTEYRSTPRQGSQRLATHDVCSTPVPEEEGDGNGPSAPAQKGKEAARASLCFVDLRSSSGSRCRSPSELKKANERQQQVALPTAREQRAFARERLKTDVPNKSAEERRASTTSIRRRVQRGLPVGLHLGYREKDRGHTRTGRDLRRKEQRSGRARPRGAGILSDEIGGGANERQTASGTVALEVVDIQSTDLGGQESGGKGGKEGNLAHDDEADSREQRAVGSRSSMGEGNPGCKLIGQSEEVIRVEGPENASASVNITPCATSMTVIAKRRNVSGPSKAGKEIGDTSDYAEVRLKELGGEKGRVDAQSRSRVEKGGENHIARGNERVVVKHQDDHADEQEKMHTRNKERSGCHSPALDIKPGPVCSLPTPSAKLEGSVCGQSRAKGAGVDAPEQVKAVAQEEAEGGGAAEPVLLSSPRGGSREGVKEIPACKDTTVVSPSRSVSRHEAAILLPADQGGGPPQDENEDVREDQRHSRRDHEDGGDGGNVPMQDGAENQCAAGHSTSERPSDSAMSSTSEKEPHDLPMRTAEYSCKGRGQDARCRSHTADSLHPGNPAHFRTTEGRHRPWVSSAARKVPSDSLQQEYWMRSASAEHIRCSHCSSRRATLSYCGKARGWHKKLQYDADFETETDEDDSPVIGGSNMEDEVDKRFAGEHAPFPGNRLQPQDVNHSTAGVKRKREREHSGWHDSQKMNACCGMPWRTHFSPRSVYGGQACTQSPSKRRKSRLHSSSCSSYPPAKGPPSYHRRKAVEVEVLCSQRHKCQKLNWRDDDLTRHLARDRHGYEMFPASPSPLAPSLSSSSTSLSPSQLPPSSSGRGKRRASHTSSHRGPVHCRLERELQHKGRSKMKHLNEWHSHVARLKSKKRDGVSADFLQTSSSYGIDRVPLSGLDRALPHELLRMNAGLVANQEDPSARATATVAPVPAATATAPATASAGHPPVVSAAAVASGGRSSTTSRAVGQLCLESDQHGGIGVKSEVTDARHQWPADISKSNPSQRGGGNEPVASPVSSCFKAAANNANSEIEAIQGGHAVICVSSDQRGPSSSTECNRAASIGAPTPCCDNLTGCHHCSDVSAQPVQGVPCCSALASNCDEHHDGHRVECAPCATLKRTGSECIQESPMDDLKHGSAIDRSDRNAAGRGDECHQRADAAEQPAFREQKLNRTEGEGVLGASVGPNSNRATIEHVIAGKIAVIKQLTDEVLLMSREAINIREDPVSRMGHAKGSPAAVGSAALVSVGNGLQKEELSCGDQKQEAANKEETSRAPAVLMESRGEGMEVVEEVHQGGGTLTGDIVERDAVNNHSNSRKDVIERMGAYEKCKDGDNEAQVGDIGGSSSVVDGHDDITSECLPPGNPPEDAEAEECAPGDFVFSSKGQATDGGGFSSKRQATDGGVFCSQRQAPDGDGAMLREKRTKKCNGTSNGNGIVESVQEEEEEEECSARTMDDSKCKTMTFVVAEEEIQGGASRCTSNGTTASRTEEVQQVNLMSHKEKQHSLGDCLSESLGRHRESLHSLIENMKKELVHVRTPGDEQILLLNKAAIEEIMLIASTAEEGWRQIFDVLPAIHAAANCGRCP